MSWPPQAKGQAEEDPNLGLFKESDEFIQNKTSFDGNKATKESPKNLSNHQNIKKKPCKSDQLTTKTKTKTKRRRSKTKES